MSSILFKQFVRKSILGKQNQGSQPPGPPPRPGLEWKASTHRWIRPGREHEGEYDHKGNRATMSFSSPEAQQDYNDKSADMFNTIVTRNKEILDAKEGGKISPKQAKAGLDHLQILANTVNGRLKKTGMSASTLSEHAQTRDTDHSSVQGGSKHRAIMDWKPKKRI